MFNHIELFYTLKIEAKNTSFFEKAGDFCLSPLHYFWDSRKVDWIETEELKACRFAPIDPGGGNWIKTALAILLFVPATLLGTLLKIPAFFFHKPDDDAFILWAYNQPPRDYYTYSIYQELKGNHLSAGKPLNQEEIKLRNIEKFLRKIACWEERKKWEKQGNKLFFSEIEEIILPRIEGRKDLEKAREEKEEILENLSFFFNLKTLYINEEIEEAKLADLKKRYPHLSFKTYVS